MTDAENDAGVSMSLSKGHTADIDALVREAYRLGYEDRRKERDYDPGHALDLLGRATGALVTERQRCICPDDLCLDHCRACNHSGRDLEECCIADPEWEPDDDDLARREGRVLPPGEGHVS